MKKTILCYSQTATIIQSAICKTRVHPRPAPTIFYYPGLNTKPIISSSNFPLHTKILKDNYDIILNEYIQLRDSIKKETKTSDYNLKNEEHKLHNGKWDWNSYILKGKKQADFASKCPKTVEILESLPLMSNTPFGYAFFSTLGSGAIISPHNGPCNLRIRCHFPLIVPKEEDNNDNNLCGMTIGGENIKWKQGEPIFFDDCYEHNVWNNSKEDRVVLLFDTWHPDLVQDEIDSIVDMFDFASKQKNWKNDQV